MSDSLSLCLQWSVRATVVHRPDPWPLEVVVHRAFWSGRGGSRLLMETADVTPMSVPSSVASVQLCCSAPSVWIPSPLRSQQEADATQPGVTCNESNKGNFQRYGQKVRESQSRGLYQRANHAGRVGMWEQDRRAVAIVWRRLTDRGCSPQPHSQPAVMTCREEYIPQAL